MYHITTNSKHAGVARVFPMGGGMSHPDDENEENFGKIEKKKENTKIWKDENFRNYSYLAYLNKSPAMLLNQYKLRS